MKLPDGFTLRSMIKDDLDFSINIWNMDISNIYRMHFGKPYFYPLILKQEGKLAGVSELVINNDTAWLGLVFVHEEYRNQGLGTVMVEHLMNKAKALGCTRQILFSTEMGAPIYLKMGFKSEDKFVLYEPTHAALPEQYHNISGITPEDFEQIFELDLQVVGEDRSQLLSVFFEDGVKHIENKRIAGYFLPQYGSGCMIAVTDDAVDNLLKYKIQSYKPNFIFPEANTVCREFLENSNYKYVKDFPRMVYGKSLDFHPGYVFCRGTGYSG